MKFFASLLATMAVSNPVPADTDMDTDIIMINMNRANIQVV